LQLVKKFPAFHGTRRFITALTSVRHLSLSWARPIQSIYPHPTSWRSILILSTHRRLGLPSGLLPSVFPSKTLLPYTNLKLVRQPRNARLHHSHDTLHTSHASSALDLCGSQRSRQMFVCILHTEYKQL